MATAYSLALGVVVPVSAWCGDRFGSTRVYNFSLIGFAAGSALCGLAWNLNSMIVFRVIQAIPGGVLPVVTLTILYRIVPREKIGAAMGMYGLGIIVAPAVGPTLGGYLVEYVDWRLIFFINVPVGIVGFFAALVVLPRFPGCATGHASTCWGFLAIAHRPVHPAAGADRGPGLGLDVLQGPHPAHGGRAQPRAVHRDRARGRPPAARRARLPLLAVHQLAAADLGAVGRPVHRAVLHPALPAAVPGPGRLRGRPAPAAPGAGHGGVHAGRRPRVRPLRPALARRDRAVDRRVGHLRAARADPRDLARATDLAPRPARVRHGHRHDADHDRRHRRGAPRDGQPGQRVQQRRAAHVGRAGPGRPDRDGGPVAGPVLGGPGRADAFGHRHARARVRPQAGELAGMYATYTQLQTQVFVEAMDGLYIVTA